ncbi:prepilin peptidase-dependent protein [Klebsiella spallanzanii]|uniref:prepilin peptidase-dependent protein n=1 Tax=Klebsiella spallanzanii TaxID=2587528 RepID=UPI00115B08D3|nr:prepilin peptidase-dependent protein [Klebsiella spallanzanii]VUS36341.1 hypothetical protein SB6419_02566 [Klebsiella spallanzanii]
MNRELGYTLIETLVTMTLVVVLSASGLYGWQSWQQQQRLWQTACQVRDYLVLLRDDANWHNRDRVLNIGQSVEGWCLSAGDAMTDCSVRNAFTLQPMWPEVSLSAMTLGLGFYGLRNTAWAGHIRLQSAAGGWNIIVSNWGRIRLCRSEETASCL